MAAAWQDVDMGPTWPVGKSRQVGGEAVKGIAEEDGLGKHSGAFRVG